MTLTVPAIGPAVVIMGVFDGVHLGHRALVAAAVDAAHERGVRSAALIFDPPPLEILRPGTSVRRLLPVDVVLDRLHSAGIEHPIRIDFDATLSALSPEDFLAALAPGIELRAMVMTPESAFGYRRAGTPERVAEIGAERGFDLVTIELLLDAGVPVSSTGIRTMLEAGEVGEATRLLGTRPLLRGRAGRPGRSATRGTGAVGLTFDYGPALPGPGVYLGQATTGSTTGEGQPVVVRVAPRADGSDIAVELLGVRPEGLSDRDGASVTLEIERSISDAAAHRLIGG